MALLGGMIVGESRNQSFDCSDDELAPAPMKRVCMSCELGGENSGIWRIEVGEKVLLKCVWKCRAFTYSKCDLALQVSRQ